MPMTNIKRNLVVHTTWGPCPQHCQSSGPPPWHPFAPPHPTDRQHQLLGSPSRLATARTRATTPHDSATRSPSCTGQSARRSRPLHQDPRPPPQPESQTASAEMRQPSWQSRHPSDTKLSPNPSQATAAPHEAAVHHGSRGHCLNPQTTTVRGRCIIFLPLQRTGKSPSKGKKLKK
jgi:hypothetical protein